MREQKSKKAGDRASVSKQLKLEEILETLNSGRLKSDTLAEIEHD